eukprot:4056364-Ditylum_brightwellii.AAC.1
MWAKLDRYPKCQDKQKKAEAEAAEVAAAAAEEEEHQQHQQQDATRCKNKMQQGKEEYFC